MTTRLAIKCCYSEVPWPDRFFPFCPSKDRSQLGGRNAAMDATAAVEALCCAPEASIAQAACTAAVAAGGLKPMVAVRSSSHLVVIAFICTIYISQDDELIHGRCFSELHLLLPDLALPFRLQCFSSSLTA